MMIVDLKPEHLYRIVLQPMQRDTVVLTDSYVRELCSSGVAFSAVDGDTVIGCGGIANAPDGGDYGILWSMLSEAASRHLVKITKATERLAKMYGGTLYTVVRSDFGQAHRWMRILGFLKVPNGHVPRALPGGFDADVYVRY